MKVEHFIAMSLTARSAETIPAVQGDSVRTVRVHVSVGGAPWAAPEGVIGRVQYTLPDGTPGQYTRTRDGAEAVTVAGNTVTWAIDGVLTEQAGAASVAVVLTAADGGQIGLFPFRVLVTAQPGIGSPESVPSMGKGFEGKLLYGGPDGAVSPLALGAGLEIRDGVLRLKVAAGGEGVAVTVDADGALRVSLDGTEIPMQVDGDGYAYWPGLTATVDADGYIVLERS